MRGIPGEVELSADDDVAAWQRLQFGLFIHWGLYSELGGVWQGRPVTSGYSEQIQMWANIPEAQYLEVAKRFQPDHFDPAQICSLAKAAGMRYVVITSKHHDGFSMFNTRTTEYDVVDATPYGKDPLKQLADACRSQGLKFGVYFSLVDWHQGHSFDGGNENPIPPSMEPVIKAQLRELMTHYGDIAEVWFDMSAPTSSQSEDFANVVRELQPHAAINSRVWNNKGDFRTLGDNEVPSVPLDGPWQTPASIYHETWGYRSWQKRDDLPGKIRDLVTGLTSVRARGGNYLLNIGPRGDGSVVEFEADVLRGIGRWLKQHPKAVLGASATRFGGQPWGEVTVNDRDLFLHVTRWPASGEIRLPGLVTGVRQVTEDGSAEQLQWRRDGDDLVVTLPETPRDDVLPVLRVELEGQLRIIPQSTQSLSATSRAAVVDANALTHGYSYADAGRYSRTTRTVVRHTAYLTTDHSRDVKMVLRGTAEPDRLYRLTVGHRSRLLTGAQLTQEAVGPFTLPRGRVTEVSVTPARPQHVGEDLGFTLDNLLVGPSDAVVAWAELPNQLVVGSRGEARVHVSNLSRRTVDGTMTLRVPAGWGDVAPVAFSKLSPGATSTVVVPLRVPPDASPGRRTFQAVATGGKHTVNLQATAEVVLPNVAQGKAATQSSTAWEGVAARAVDGNTGGSYFGDNSTTHTAEPSTEAWWQVDLGQGYDLDSIEVWNRSDCCTERLSNYWVLVSQTPITMHSLQEARAMPGIVAIRMGDPAARPTHIPLSGTHGRYVRVQLESATDPLSLSEFVVRGLPK
ncbi:alpha-L-fucosidase [Streptomyces spinoverrucosus]|uniref:alpha-L-fucosidase n=1 Tax=Streptomyces spinoverrucosus TaxID=284043 RepID=UPI0018C3D7AD|nr:alpha-L-fucosidase [Streptomyces spinoverrucosus]MBG0857747.1 alpha-L-fucosidase [Streptomyces spinoverrucosus]